MERISRRMRNPQICTYGDRLSAVIDIECSAERTNIYKKGNQKNQTASNQNDESKSLPYSNKAKKYSANVFLQC